MYGRDGRLLKRYEQTGFKRAKNVLVCSEDEYQKVKALDPTINVAVVPNGVDCEEYRPLNGDAFDNEPEIIFVGDMAYAPNHEGVFEFIKEVLPTIQEVGSYCSIDSRGQVSECFAHRGDQTSSRYRSYRVRR